MSLRHAILGLIDLSPMTGWDLKTQFDKSLGAVWSTSESQLYAEIRRLELEGLIETERVIQHDRPNKKVCHITASGREELHRWLAADVEPPQVKDDFLTKMFFLSKASIEVRRRQVQEYLTYLMGRSDHLLNYQQKYVGRLEERADPVLQWQMHVLHLSVRRTEVEVAWALALLDDLPS